MSGADPQPPRLDELGAKLAAIRKRRAPPKRGGSGMRGHELAWRMVIDLTAGIAVGLAIGWGLDTLLGTKPVLMIVFVLLGFGAGVRVMLQSAKDAQRRLADAKASEAAAAGAQASGATTTGARPSGATTTGATASEGTPNGASAPQDEGR